MKRKQFELTGKCNLECEFCYNQAYMPFWKELPEEFVVDKAGEGNVIFLGGGEPTLYKNIAALVRRLIENRNIVVLSTNGLLYREFPQSDRFRLQISLPALDKELYKGITHVDGIEKVRANILRYKETHSTHINMPVYNRNINEMPKIAEFCKQHELPLVISQLMPVHGLEPLAADIVKRKCLEAIFSTGADIRFTENRTKPYEMEEYQIPCST